MSRVSRIWFTIYFLQYDHNFFTHNHSGNETLIIANYSCAETYETEKFYIMKNQV